MLKRLHEANLRRVAERQKWQQEKRILRTPAEVARDLQPLQVPQVQTKRRNKVKPFPTVHETIRARQLTAKEWAEAKSQYESAEAKSQYKDSQRNRTFDEKADDLFEKIAIPLFISFVFTAPAMFALFFTPDVLEESRFKGRIRLTLLLWLVAIYVTAIISAFMLNEDLGLLVFVLFLATLGVLFWFGRNDAYGQIDPRR